MISKEQFDNLVTDFVNSTGVLPHEATILEMQLWHWATLESQAGKDIIIEGIKNSHAKKKVSAQ